VKARAELLDRRARYAVEAEFRRERRMNKGDSGTAKISPE
jgi:hypothetical protein